MQIFVSLAKGIQINAQALTSVIGVRVLDHRLLREADGFAYYAFVAFSEDDSGDYDLKVAKLRRQGLAANNFKLAGITDVDSGYQSVYDASMAMEKLNARGRYTSLSSPPPIQSAIFQLNDFRIQMTPDVQTKLDLWYNAQEIVPLRYAVLNPRTQSIEVAFEDPSAHNSDIIQRMLRESLYQALGDYSAGKDFTVPGRNSL